MPPLSDIDAAEALRSDPAICRKLLTRLEDTLAGRPMRFMEVCGTHTVAIFQSGLRSLLPAGVIHLSGPGCPVCVTHESEVALFLELAARKDVIIATFGDLLRVPDAAGFSLKHAKAAGAHVEIVYSPLDALAIAKNNPEKETVFLGIGFETTAPAVAAAILAAQKAGLANFSVLPMHKLVPPALDALMAESDCTVDAFLLPGHVATITGLAPFAFLAARHKPAVVGGFEPADILLALTALASQMAFCEARVENAYPRAVDTQGNPRALSLMEKVFAPTAAQWRGLGLIANSGLAIRPEFQCFDASQKLNLEIPEVRSPSGCRCGAILKGQLQPSQCPLFGKKCTPASPVGPCMVSTEGSCAAHFKYGVQ